MGLLVGVALRAGMLAMLRHVLRASPRDHRFTEKGIAARAVIMVPAAGITFPALWLAGGSRRAPYPAWPDNLFLSIVALDLAGNVFDLYDRHRHFDLIPHAHGTGGLTVVAAWLLGIPARQAIGLATAGHAALEVQEIVSDVLFGYRNVRGWWDTAGDLAIGVAGSVVYVAAFERLVRRAGREPASPLARRAMSTASAIPASETATKR